MCICVGVYRYPQRPAEGTGFLKNCSCRWLVRCQEDAGIRTLVLGKTEVWMGPGSVQVTVRMENQQCHRTVRFHSCVAF